ncbi:hypothetical protein ZIOFF_058282 [Zingiber officinale]|uniref:Coatomer subunit zeta n=1 Tax=Zingiber officinale TaxID=94328 RepID=A0A8J5F7V8_ZINOF|nr:hypothetical protein ZIOFF_058282 [Zingiber officinale]
MILAVLFTNTEGNILVERYAALSPICPTSSVNHFSSASTVRILFEFEQISQIFRPSMLSDFQVCGSLSHFHGVPSEERLHWRSFLVKLGAENLKGTKNEELLVASHKSVFVVYTMLGDVCIYVIGKDEYDELALAEVIFVITSSVKDVCGKPPSERLFLDHYGKICLCLDEIIWKGMLENTDKDRIRRLIRLKAPADI